MADDEPIVVNHHQADLNVSTRVLKSGAVRSKSYVTTTVTSEPMAFMLDDLTVTKHVAEVLARQIREQTRAIVSTVSASTRRYRRTVERAVSKGKPWALSRFSGGKMGITPPMPTNTEFNHSGRLADSIVARWSERTKQMIIYHAANRWNVRDFKSEADMRMAFQRWVMKVPVLVDASNDIAVQRAVRETFADVVSKGAMGEDAKRRKMLATARLDAFKKLAEALSSGDSRRDDEEEAA